MTKKRFDVTVTRKGDLVTNKIVSADDADHAKRLVSNQEEKNLPDGFVTQDVSFEVHEVKAEA